MTCGNVRGNTTGGYYCEKCGMWFHNDGPEHVCSSPTVVISPFTYTTLSACWTCPFAAGCIKAVKPNCFEGKNAQGNQS